MVEARRPGREGGGARTPALAGPVVAVAGARPNLVKLGPLVRAAAAAGRALPWIHTGQHQSPAMAGRLVEDVGVSPPTEWLAHVPPGPRRAERMAGPLAAALARLRPGLVVVIGDVDSTVAGALAAARLRVPVAHVESGLRCHDRAMPEERNRVRVDRLSLLHHVSEPYAVGELRAEGVAPASIHRAGNVVADALAWARQHPRPPRAAWARGLSARAYGVVTLHRAANVDDPERLSRWLDALSAAARVLPLVFPVHPRTRRRLPAARVRALARRGVRLVAPLLHRQFLALLDEARLAVTDSGGVPLEASLLGVPCLTLRARFEHRLTQTRGTNRLLGADPRRLGPAVADLVERGGGPAFPARLPPEWDGRAAQRIVGRWARGGSFEV